ncbi:MAG: preprotein translocase subunit YajC [Alphaproteobacteria bacterium]|nr:preprotein translocase subunit YajC [Alphaproteobacteria bacterium]
MEPLTDGVNAATQSGNAWGMIIYCAVVFGIIYFLIVRPGKRRMAEYQKMLNSLRVGDRVLAAGIYGVIKKIGETTIDVEIAKGVVVEVAKNAVANVEK